MKLANPITIEQGAFALDGGSIYLSLRDDDGGKHSLVLVQHRIPMDDSDPRLPGRLYLDGAVVDIRSAEEHELMSAIKMADIAPLPGDAKNPPGESGPGAVVGEDIKKFLSATKQSQAAAIRHLVDEMVKFVESEAYAKLADRATGRDTS